MRIGVISNLYKPYTRGGAERIVEIMVAELANAGHDVFVISSKPAGGLELAQEDGVRVYRFRPVNIFYYLDDFKHNFLMRFIWNVFDIFNLFSASTVNKILKQEKPDLVITHNLKGLGLNLPLVIKKNNLKHFHVLHDIQLNNASGLLMWGKEKSFFERGFLARIYQNILRRYFSGVHKAFFPSTWLKKYYESNNFFNKTENIVLRNPMPALATEVIPKAEKQQTYLFLGQLEPHKGIRWLLNFWLKNKIPAKLIIAGKGSFDLTPYRDKENLKIVGYIERADLPKLFAQADFLIFPSLCYENSPNVIMEAFQYSTPTIVANIGGTAELVSPSRNGYVFEPKDEAQLLNLVQQTLNLTNGEFAQLSQNALATVQIENLTADSYIEMLLAGLS